MRRTIKSFAKADNREYVTPEDVTKSIASGVGKAALQQEALTILGETAGVGIEDRGLFAFVAADFDRIKRDETAKARRRAKRKGRQQS